MATATLLPTGDYASVAIAAYSSGTTAHNLLTDNEATNKISFFTNDGSVEVTIQSMSSALSINSVTVVCVDQGTGGGADTYSSASVYVRIGGVNYTSAVGATGAGRTYSGTWTANPATGAAWTTVGVNSIQAIGFSVSTYITANSSPTYLVASVDYVALPPSVDVTRHVATVALHTLKQPEVIVKVIGNLDINGTDASPLELLGDAQLEHTAGPVATGAGWEADVTKRRAVSPHVITVNPMAYETEVDFKDIRYLKALVWFPAYSNKNSGALEDGIPRMMTPGATFTFTRAAEETFTDPVGDSVTVAANVPGYASGGLQMLAGSSATFTNNSGERTWNVEQGTFACEVKLAAVSGVNLQTVAFARHDANNSAFVYWDGPNGRWTFRIRAAGVTYDATFAATPSSGVWYQIGARWTGTNGELGVTARTASIWVDRVKGTDVVSVVPTEAGTATFDIGSTGSAGNILNGQIRKILSCQYVFTDTEMQRSL